MKQPKPHHKYGLYKDGELTHSFGDLPGILSFLDTDKDGLAEGWKEMVDQDPSLELRSLDTGGVIFASKSEVDTSQPVTQSKAVWDTADGTMPKIFSHLFADQNNNELPDLFEQILGDFLVEQDTAGPSNSTKKRKYSTHTQNTPTQSATTSELYKPADRDHQMHSHHSMQIYFASYYSS